MAAILFGAAPPPVETGYDIAAVNLGDYIINGNPAPLSRREAVCRALFNILTVNNDDIVLTGSPGIPDISAILPLHAGDGTPPRGSLGAGLLVVYAFMKNPATPAARMPLFSAESVVGLYAFVAGTGKDDIPPGQRFNITRLAHLLLSPGAIIAVAAIARAVAAAEPRTRSSYFAGAIRTLSADLANFGAAIERVTSSHPRADPISSEDVAINKMKWIAVRMREYIAPDWRVL